MKTNRLTRCAIALAAVAAFGAGAPALHAQEQTFDLKISHWVPPSHPLQKALEEWAASVEKASNGTLRSKVYPSQQLGKAFDHYDMARDGIADFAYVNPGYQPGRFPVMAGASLPFLFANAKGGTAAIDAWYKQYAAQEMKDVKVCFAFVHDPGTFHARKKITLPTDIKGMKIRPATSTIGNMVTSLGGTNVQSSAPEARDMLERGVAEAITFPWGSLNLFGIDKVVKYHMDVPLYVTPFVWVMNKAKYDGMSAGQKTDPIFLLSRKLISADATPGAVAPVGLVVGSTQPASLPLAHSVATHGTVSSQKRPKARRQSSAV